MESHSSKHHYQEHTVRWHQTSSIHFTYRILGPEAIHPLFSILFYCIPQALMAYYQNDYSIELTRVA